MPGHAAGGRIFCDKLPAVAATREMAETADIAISVGFNRVRDPGMALVKETVGGGNTTEFCGFGLPPIPARDAPLVTPGPAELARS